MGKIIFHLNRELRHIECLEKRGDNRSKAIKI